MSAEDMLLATVTYIKWLAPFMLLYTVFSFAEDWIDLIKRAVRVTRNRSF